MADKTAFAMHLLYKFLFCVLPGEAETDQRTRGQRTRPFGRHRTASVERIGRIDHASAAVCADSTSATHVADDKVQFLIFLAAFLGEKSCHRLLIERMEYRLTRQLGKTGDARVRHHLVHHHRVGDISLHPYFSDDLMSEKTAEV